MLGVYSSEKTLVQEVSNQKRGWAFIQDGLVFARVTDGITITVSKLTIFNNPGFVLVSNTSG